LAKADGTPEFGRINYGGAITSSKIEINHHYFYLGRRDLDAVGTLTNFKSWSSSSDTATNNLVTNAGGTGKIGDREVFEVGSQVYELVEAHPNKEFFCGLQAIKSGDQGNFRRDQGIPLPSALWHSPLVTNPIVPTDFERSREGEKAPPDA
jgi:hypothetical protein